MRSTKITVTCSLVLALGVSGCGSDSKSAQSSSTTTTSKAAAKPTTVGTAKLSTVEPAGCDSLDTTACLLPFPSNTYTVADAKSPTGKRIHLTTAVMPMNKDGVRINADKWNGLDGFSPGSPILVRFPGIDLAKSKVAPITDIASSLDEDAPIVLLDMTTKKRVPYWAELDEQATKENPVLFVRPAVNFLETHHIAVAFRNLVDTAGSAIAPSELFTAYRDRLKTTSSALEARRADYEETFAALGKHGVKRDSLIAAWDFTIASSQSLAGNTLTMRDAAFKQLGDAAPKFAVTSVKDNPDPLTARVVQGTYEVPNFLVGDGSPGKPMNLTNGGKPAITSTPFIAPFTCVVPAAALTGKDGAAATPGRPVIYGHGLLGSGDEITDAPNILTITDMYNFVYCATNWAGFSSDDIPFAITTLNDFSNFPTLSERSQQGFIAQLFLARLMKHEEGLVTDSAFQTAAGDPVLKTGDNLYYDGNSQGGIMGGALTAISTEWTKAVLGVPGMNYTTLLNRSIDFDTYKAILDPAYPDPVDRTFALVLAQMFWDRFETDGYAQHLLNDEYEGTPKHQVLMHVAVGDHQVSTYAADVMARTIGAKRVKQELQPGRSNDVTPLWGILETTLPSKDSVYLYVDSGQPLPPLGNIPPTGGKDPHGDPRMDPEVMAQKDAFFQPDGEIIDTCDSAPCVAVARKK